MDQKAQQQPTAKQQASRLKQFYLDRNPKSLTSIVFKLFSQDGGHSISAVDFVKMCKQLKVYPVALSTHSFALGDHPL